MNQDQQNSDSGGAERALPEQLEPIAIRVLAVLAEKEMLTPDIYPLSANALTNGCNQLSSRDPIMAISEETVRQVLDALIAARLVAEVSQAGARVSKFEHRMRIKWSLEQDKLTVLTLLMLRGAQTAGEIRARCGRMHDFASIAEVESCLQFLIDKYPPMVTVLPRAPGTKEVRYMHLLAGEPLVEQIQTEASLSAGTSRSGDRIATLEAEVTALRTELEALKTQFAQFQQQFE